MDVKTPDGKKLATSIVCCCSIHCVNNTTHDPSCCAHHFSWCDCFCHRDQYQALTEKEALILKTVS